MAIIVSLAIGCSVLLTPLASLCAPRSKSANSRNHRHVVKVTKATKRSAVVATRRSQAKHSRRKATTNVKGDRIAAFVAEVQPRKGPRYARRVALAIRHASKTTGISPDVLLATGYVESEFRSGAGPCKGVMQVHPATLREMRRHIPAARKLDPDRIEDNIQLGALELASYYHRPTKSARSASRLNSAWGRYSGTSSRGGYVRRARLVLRRIRQGDTKQWRRHLQRGPLWTA